MADRAGERNRVRRAWLLLIGLLALVLLAIYVGQVRRGGQETYQLVGRLPAVDGVQSGTPVLVNGVHAGRVALVQIAATTSDTLGNFTIRIELVRSVQPVIRTDSELRLARPRPLGPPVIEISGGSAGAPPLQEGDTLQLGVRLANQQIVNNARELGEATAAWSESRQALAERIGPEQAEAVRQLAYEVEAAVMELEVFAAEIRAGPLDPQQRQRLEAAAEQLRATAAAMQPQIQRWTDLLDEPLPHLDPLRRQIALLQVKIEQSRGLLWRLPRDRAIERSIDEIGEQIDSLIQQARRNPLRFLF
jgi:ABC-type transporter Mla subunit MlaD